MRIFKSVVACGLPLFAAACAGEVAGPNGPISSELAAGTLAFTGAAAADITVETGLLRFPKSTHPALASAEVGRRRAAVAPASAAEVYNLSILRNDIQDSEDNRTRFVLLSAKQA